MLKKNKYLKTFFSKMRLNNKIWKKLFLRKLACIMCSQISLQRLIALRRQYIHVLDKNSSFYLTRSTSGFSGNFELWVCSINIFCIPEILYYPHLTIHFRRHNIHLQFSTCCPNSNCYCVPENRF